jgi:hypothetical protein
MECGSAAVVFGMLMCMCFILLRQIRCSFKLMDVTTASRTWHVSDIGCLLSLKILSKIGMGESRRIGVGVRSSEG